MSYQGYSNEQTWCVCLTLNNTKSYQDKAKAAPDIEELKRYCHTLRGEIFSMAYWAWPEAYQENQVNWVEVYEELNHV